jgi:hypothetical protein
MPDYTPEMFTAAERRGLEQMLDCQRAELAKITDGLTEEEARRNLVPSLTTPLGLMKHGIFVEQAWFHSCVAGRSRQEVGMPRDRDESFRLTDDDTIASVRAEFDAVCAASRTIAAGHPDLDEQLHSRLGPVSLRFIYVHMIQEYARHAGHGDILVEQIAAD